MNPTNINLFLMIYIPLYVISHTGLFLLFRKANVKLAWLAFVPIACYWPWIQLAGRPKTWMIWAFIPAADVIIWFSLVIDMMESFGKFKFWEQVVGVLFPFYMYPKLALDKKVIYLGQSRNLDFRKKVLPPRQSSRDWADALFFALVVAYMIRMFQLEPYKIPSSSMEDSMMVGDFLFVSKMNYGPRFPITPVAFPLVHQDFLGTKAYSEVIQLPYIRLWGPQNVKRNDPVVFNVPDDQLDPTPRPADKMQNYVKRCVGIPGDKIEVKNGVLFVNDVEAWKAPGMLHFYFIRFKKNATLPTEDVLTKEYDIYDFFYVDNNTMVMALSDADLEKIKTDFGVEFVLQQKQPKKGNFYTPDSRKMFNAVIKTKDSQRLSDADIIKMKIVYMDPLRSDGTLYNVLMDPAYINPAKYKEIPKIDSIGEAYQINGSGAFPNYPEKYPWNTDNYGPIYLPKRGESIAIDKNNFYIYEKAIKDYENNPTFELRGSTAYLDGQPIKSYTFKMDYYWMMGDNRDNSADSRSWGYVPESHIVGKPLFVFFSIQYKHAADPKPGTDGNEFVKIRWNRLFKVIR